MLQRGFLISNYISSGSNLNKLVYFVFETFDICSIFSRITLNFLLNRELSREFRL